MRYSRKPKRTGAIRGSYKEYSYESCLELAFILESEAAGLKVSNYDMEPIEYIHNQKVRKYTPDFILNDSIIVEVKWLGFIYEQKKEEIELKKKALEEFCQSQNFFSAFVTNEDVNKSFIKKARKLHERLKYGSRVHVKKRKRSKTSTKRS